MIFKIQNLKFKFFAAFPETKFGVLCRLCLLVTALAAAASGQNGLQKIADGGHLENWLISNHFPAEIDAGMWENFNRFNIEALPRKDWLAPFGSVGGIKPQAGTFKATEAVRNNPQAEFQNPKLKAELPEVGAVSTAKNLPDAAEISWTPFAETDAVIDFFRFHEGRPVGTAYAAAYIDSTKEETRYLETDGFLGVIWLNGEKIYDGFSLTLKKTSAARFKTGKNLLLVRGTGVSGDYWRKDGGWTALVRFWNSETAAQKSAAYKSSGAPGTVFYLEGFHVDPVYLQDQRGYAKVTLSNTNQYVQSLRADPLYGVFLSEIDYLKPYFDTHPEDREFLREAVRAGRVGTGGAYNQFNELNIGGEAMIRNILYGQEMHEAMLGRRAKSLALWDVFGHAPQLSQIAAKSGFTGVAWSKKITGFEPFFYDYALDGTRLLHRRVDYAYSFSGFGSGKNYTLDNFRRMTERKFQETQSFGSKNDLRINAADFTPPWTNLAGNVAPLEAQSPRIRVTGQAQDLFFDAVGEEIKQGVLKPPVTSRDKLFFHVGVMMARSDLKVAHRAVENVTLTAEKFGALAYLYGAKYPDLALDKAWRQIFFGSHHDAITGTPSDSALIDLVHGYREAYDLSKGALDDSLKFIANKINTKTQNPKPKTQIPLVVFNPLNWKRTDAARAKIKFDAPVANFQIRDEKGAIVAQPRILNAAGGTIEFEFVAPDVPSLGYRTFYAEPLERRRVSIDRSYPEFLENEFYRIMIDAGRGGAVVSIFDKQANREIIKQNGERLANEIGVLEEELTRKNVIYPAWEMWTTGKKSFSGETKAIFSFEENGDTKTYKIQGVLPNKTPFVQTISLHRGVKRIDFKTELVGYKGKDELFVVNFPLNLTGGALVTEDRFGTVVRNGSRGFLDFKTNTDKLVSGAPVYGVNNWAAYGSTFDLRFVENPAPAGSITKSEKVVASVPLKLSALVRPHGEAFESATETLVAGLIKRGVSVTPFYDDNDIERRKSLPIEDSTMPKSLNDDIAYHSFRIALGGERENVYSARLLKQVSPETRAKFELRLQRDGYAFLFLYDKEIPTGWKPVPVLLIGGNVEKAAEKLVLPIRKGASNAQPSFFESDAARREYEALDTFSFTLSLEAFAVETNPNKDLPQVPDYGVALINNGTPAVSLENPDTLTLHLTHTAAFPGVNLPFEFVPENKTHVFNYALYPHADTWREAETVKVGHDFNNPLIGVQTDLHDGELPAEKSFVQTKVPNLVISALKLGGNPQATFNSKEENEMSSYPILSLRGSKLRSLVLRAYETSGDATYSGIETDFKIDFGSQTGMIEQKQSLGIGFGGFNVNDTQGFDAFEIKTFELFAPRKSTENAPLGATKEAVQPVFSRYWQHNPGAAPIGNDAVKVTLRPTEQMGSLSTFSWDDPYNQGGVTTVGVRVQVVNNYRDRKIAGEVSLEVPEDWRVVPEKLVYEIEPNGSFVRDVIITAFPVKKNLDFERASGLIKARIEHGGQTFQDVLNLGKPFKLEWRTEKSGDAVSIYVKNPHRQAIEGAVALVKPYENWLFADSNAPREQGFTVPARGEIVLKFDRDKTDAENWTIARLAYNGWVEYLRADDFAVVPVKK
jgi:alpha-mannosidase